MVMTLRAEDGDCVLTYKYMDLSQVSEKEKTKQGSDELTVRSSSVRGVIRRMDEKNGKILDLNHVKVLLLEAEFLEEKDFMQELVEIGNSGVDLPGNMIVFVAEDVDAISNLKKWTKIWAIIWQRCWRAIPITRIPAERLLRA